MKTLTIIIVTIVIVITVLFLWNGCKIHCDYTPFNTRDNYIPNYYEAFSFGDILNAGKNVIQGATPYVKQAIPYIQQAGPLVKEHLPGIIDSLRNDGAPPDKLQCVQQCLQ